MAREPSYYLRRFESLRAERSAYDQRWQMVSDYILPRRDFSVTTRGAQLRPYRVTSSLATNLNTRLAAFVLAYWLDTSRPFLLPNIKRGLAVDGRPTDLDDDGIRYLDALAWNVFDHMLRPKAALMLRAGSMLKEFCAFGAGVLWQGRRRGFGPYFNSRSLAASWWSMNEEGKIDVLYYKMMLPIYRIKQRWPDSAIHFQNNEDANEQNLMEVLLCCEPRPGGKPGAVGVAKPFEWTVLLMSNKNAILEESGYDSFPYAVFLNDPMPGQAYAEGQGCQVLPDVMVLNHLQQVVEAGSSDKGMPPLAMPARMFSKALDRRRGAINHYNPQSLGLQKAGDAIVKLDFTGELQDAMALIPELKDDISMGYFADWMKLRESGDMTAEEVTAWKDINFRGMASIVANLEAPTTDMGDRAMEIMLLEGVIPPAPASVAGAGVDWEYAGPLAVAQQAGNVNVGLRLINARGLVAPQDPAAAEAVDLEATLRMIAQSLGAPPNLLNSHAKVEAIRAQQAHAAEQQANAAKLAQVAGAAKDASGAVQGIAGAMGQPAPGGAAPGGGGAPFAPAAPFAQPMAA